MNENKALSYINKPASKIPMPNAMVKNNVKESSEDMERLINLPRTKQQNAAPSAEIVNF